MSLEGDFDENSLILLPREDQDFLLEFILCGGNFSNLTQKIGLTYPTLRSRLDRIIGELRKLESAERADDIINSIDQGKISPEAAINKLKKLKKR